MFVDSSAWIAISNRRDDRHIAMVRRYQELVAVRTTFVTTNYVVAETATRLRYGGGLTAALAFHESLGSAVSRRLLRLHWIDEELDSEAWRILSQYADVKLSLTDASSAAAARQLRIAEVLGCDRHFEALGFVVSPGLA
ncbi:MAG TPA: PIN domain-containing protein [Chloroflexota bacterium]|nr:PIN domain-containing protein [Chloroflexota bacterium]